MKSKNYSLVCVLFALQFPANPAQATLLTTTINTSTSSGVSADIVFDFISGDGISLNSVSISNFVTDGVITAGTAVETGAASGDLTSTATLQNIQFFNEISQPITLGTSISFAANITQNFDSSATIPDALSVYLLNPNGTALFTTNDPTDTNALFTFNIDGTITGNLNAYSAIQYSSPFTWTTTAQPSTVPLPPALYLFASAVLLIRLKAYKSSMQLEANIISSAC